MKIGRRQAAIGKAKADVSADGQVLVRYMTQSDRTYNAAMRMMLALKADRRKYGDEDDDESAPGDAPAADVGEEEDRAPEVASAPVEIDPEPAVIPAVEDQKPTEAVPTQVVAPVAGNNPVAPAPAVLLPAASPIDHDPLVAVIEKYKKEFAHLREFDHLK